MNRMLLVALREFRQIAATRSFWITLMLLPVALVLSQASTRLLRPPAGVAYTIVDETGRYAPAIQRRMAVDAERRSLAALATYADRWKIAAPGAVWAGGPRLFTDADVAAFEAAGGPKAAEAQVARLKPAQAPDFRPPAEPFIAIKPPPGVVTDEGPDRFGETLAPHLKADVATPAGKRQLALAVYIPAGYGETAAPARLWTNGRPNATLVDLVRQELTQALRAQAFAASGIDPAALARVQAVSAPVTLTTPPAGAGRERMVLRSALPLAMSYLLLMSLMISGAWMLQGLIEERSNKLIETVLACVSPDELLYGKLMGVMGVGLTMIVVWIGFALGAAFSVQGVVADFLRPALASVSSPWIVAALIYFFLAGYLAISMLFLAVGSVSESMRDAQGYLTPIILALTIPFVAIMSAVIQNPDGPLPRIMSWIPLYTPFAMMARLGGGVSPLEVLGSAILLAAFVAFELVMLGRIFRANLLSAGQPLKLKDLPRLLRASPV